MLRQKPTARLWMRKTSANSAAPSVDARSAPTERQSVVRLPAPWSISPQDRRRTRLARTNSGAGRLAVVAGTDTRVDPFQGSQQRGVVPGSGQAPTGQAAGAQLP